MSGSGELGFREVVAMGVGGLIGGGIFAVLGVAAHVAGNAVVLAYALAGMIALASGYSYSRMTQHLNEEGGSFTFLEHYASNFSDLVNAALMRFAGTIGWILIVGYVGTMAMYAYAFGSFAVKLLGVPVHSLIRAAISMGVIALFVGINLLGVEESGHSEDIMVYAKAAILVLFGGIGSWMIFTRPDIVAFRGGLFNKTVFAPLFGFAVLFVSFEGWQLLSYDCDEIKGGVPMMERGIYASIVISTLIYVLVAFVTTTLLTPQQIQHHTEVALAVAAGELFTSQLINRVSFILVSLAALFSTASAINATLFGTARLAHKIATEQQLPGVFSFRNRKGVPSKSLIIIGILTAVFTALGSLESITTFASVAFLFIFGIVNLVVLLDSGVREQPLIPLFGFLGILAALPLLIFHLYRTDPRILASIGVILTLILYFEYIYFAREPLEEAAEEVVEEVERAEEFVEEEAERSEQVVEEEAEQAEHAIEEEAERIEDAVEDNEGEEK